MDNVYRTDCFAFYCTSSGAYKCQSLRKLDCKNCRFYKTKQDYELYVKPLEHK